MCKVTQLVRPRLCCEALPSTITLPCWALGRIRTRWQVSKLNTSSFLWKPGDTQAHFSWLLPLWLISFLYLVIIRQPEPFLNVRLMLWNGRADCLRRLPGGPSTRSCQHQARSPFVTEVSGWLCTAGSYPQYSGTGTSLLQSGP